MGTFHAKRSHKQNSRRDGATAAVVAIAVVGAGSAAYSSSQQSAAAREANAINLEQRKQDARALREAEPIAIAAEEEALDIELAGLREAADVDIAGLEQQLAEEERIRGEEVERLDEITADLEEEEQALVQRAEAVEEDVRSEIERIQAQAVETRERLEAEKETIGEGQEELKADIEAQLTRVDQTEQEEIDRLQTLAEQERTRLTELVDEVRLEREQLRGEFQPFIEPGLAALETLRTGEGIREEVLGDPRTQLALEEGQREIRRAAARRGGLFAGAAIEAEGQFARETVAEGITRVEDRLQREADRGLEALTALGGIQADLLGTQTTAASDLTALNAELSRQTGAVRAGAEASRISLLDIGSEAALGFGNLSVDLANTIAQAELGFSGDISRITTAGVAAAQDFSSQQLSLQDLITQTGLEKSQTITEGESLVASLEQQIAQSEADLITDIAAAEASSARAIGDIKAETAAALGPLEDEIAAAEGKIAEVTKPKSDVVGRFVTSDTLANISSFGGLTKGMTTAGAPAKFGEGTFEILASGKFKDFQGRELTLEEVQAA